MCGIFAVLSSNIKENGELEKQNFHKGKNRGPERSVLKKMNDLEGKTIHLDKFPLYMCVWWEFDCVILR